MFQHEVDRNQELLGRIKKLEERETGTAKNLSEQLEANHTLRKKLEGLNKKLEERDISLTSANQVYKHTHSHSICLYSGHVSENMLAHFYFLLFPEQQLFEG